MEHLCRMCQAAVPFLAHPEPPAEHVFPHSWYLRTSFMAPQSCKISLSTSTWHWPRWPFPRLGGQSSMHWREGSLQLWGMFLTLCCLMSLGRVPLGSIHGLLGLLWGAASAAQDSLLGVPHWIPHFIPITVTLVLIFSFFVSVDWEVGPLVLGLCPPIPEYAIGSYRSSAGPEFNLNKYRWTSQQDLYYWFGLLRNRYTG